MATTKTRPITLFVPFTRIERRAEDDALIVEGYCFVNPTVKGDRYSIKRSAMEAATPDYLKFPAVREMHQPIAAGTGLEVIWDEKGCLLRSECVDEGTKKKIDKKVLRGYSVGVNPLTLRGDEVESLDWVETSYVDRPKDPDAVFLYRADGFDPEAEVEVTVLDATDVAAAAPAPPAAAAPDPAIPSPSLSDSSGELSPSAGSDPLAEGEPSSTQRAAVVAALVAQGMAPEAAERLADSVEVVEERALGAPVVALPNASSAENASASAVNDALGGGAPGDYRVERAPTGMWCAYGPSGDKLGEFETEAEARAHVAECKRQMSEGGAERAMTSEGAPTRENLDGPKKCPAHDDAECKRGCKGKRCMDAEDAERAAVVALGLERVIKHEGEKWVVYSESGKKLGEHDSEAEAKDQLQAIEISKHKDDPGATQPKKDRAAQITAELEAMVARAAELQRELSGEAPAAPAVEETPPAVPEQRAAEPIEADVAAGTERPVPETATSPQISRFSVPWEIVDVASGGFLLRNTETGSDSKYAYRAEAEARLAEITRDAKADAYDALAAQATTRYTVRAACSDRYAIHDATTDAFVTKFFDYRVPLFFKDTESAEAYIADRQAADAQQTSNPGWLTLEGQRAAMAAENRWATFDTVSREGSRDDPTEIQRLEASNAELRQRLAANEGALQRLAAAEAEVQRLRELPAREKPVVRFPHALERSFIANLGHEGEAEIQVLRTAYEAAEKEAEAQRFGDVDKRNRAVERMMQYQSELAMRGVKL